MTTIESREIRGITLRILYLLVAFAVVSTAGVMSSYFSLKSDNELLNTQIQVLKVQIRGIDQQLQNIEGKKFTPYNPNTQSYQHENNVPARPIAAALGGLQNP